MDLWGWRFSCGLLLVLAGCSGASSTLEPMTSDGRGAPNDAGPDTKNPIDASIEDAVEDAGPDVDAAPLDAGAPDTGPPLRALFVGNSYTSVNDLPAVVRALGAATPGAAVEAEVITMDGALLSGHWANDDVRQRIASGSFDAVVLQGQSLEPLELTEDFDYYASLFAGALAETKTRGVWFATWARRVPEPRYGTPAQMTNSLETRYELAAKVNGDPVARVGAAWQIALGELPSVVLYADDGSHPTPAGTLLAGCVILQALTGKTPRVPEPAPFGIEQDAANSLCAIAPRVRCDTGMGFCDGACVDLEYNPAHCGACGVECSGSDPCRNRVCGCPPGRTGCSRNCVDLLTDPLNCGVCGAPCSAGSVCERGACGCKRAGRRDVTPAELATLRPECNSRDAFGSAACNEAAYGYCAALDCFNSGFGPPSGHAPVVDSVMCVAGDVQSTAYATLAAQVAACDGIAERAGQNCSSAIHRHCASLGAVSGFGPITSSGDAATFTCVSNATVIHTTFDALRAFASRCVAHPVTCGVASWSFCTSLGHAGGFGPVEVSGNDADVVCVDP